MQILVIGAAGYAGRQVATALRRQGHSVLGMTRDTTSARATALTAAEVRPVAGDLADPASYRSHLREVDAVVHLSMDTNDPAGADLALFAELEAAGGPHLVYTTGCSSYGRVDAPVLDENTPGNPGGALYFRLELEQRLAASGLPHTVLRPGFIYGGEARTSQAGNWFAAGRSGRAVFYGDRAKSWTWVHVDDLAEAYTAVVAGIGGGLPSGEVFCVGEENPPTALEVFTACVRAAGHTGPVEFAPIEQAGWLDRAADHDEVMTSAKAREVLGWTPRHAGVLADVDTYYRAWAAS
ncbi:NAD-dependent epimerase/dehydratase family protein [Saccharothrix coeruleofusca]|uniref:NAD-dependent epimerase n=1 Tax=Saccharothrix coeruleofusca TaxID=33919 RepID=A0A918AK39_9PSEU|nr:NAD-dependent epimerase/dehydratase family protein [Saccharothrix coeruleofusca]GGP47352.1 NAD-dependent epimerase [Saccharothrix coeruleofusca]